MGALSGKVARIRYTAATATGSTNEAATLAADTVTLSINATAKRHWDRSSTLPRVYSSTSTGTVLAQSLYDVNHVQGKVVFRAAQSSTKTFTLDVAWLAASYLTGGREWETVVQTDMLDVTAFSTSGTNVGWRTMRPGLSEANVTIGRIVSTGDTGPLFYDRLNAVSSNLIVELVARGTGFEKYEGFARVARLSAEAEPGGIVSENVELTVDGHLYYSTV